MWISRSLLVAVAVTALVSGCSKKDSPTAPSGGGGGGGTSETFASGNFTSGVFVHTFGTTPGTYSYRCTLHATMGMTGEVIVDAGSANDSAFVTINSMTFGPSSISVKPGGYVKWENGGSAGIHNVTRP
jgi:plastocyanin